jgi:Pilus formation protein N terminal region
LSAWAPQAPASAGEEAFPMSCRISLAVAFALAFGASPAIAAASPDVLAVTLDQAKVAKLPAGTTTLIIGNPMIADVTMLKNSNSMVITGKGFGQTNLIAIGADGSVIDEKQLRVVPANTVLILQSGPSRVSYACNPDCMPTVQLGDDDDHFSKTGNQITLHNGLAQGAVSVSTGK